MAPASSASHGHHPGRLNLRRHAGHDTPSSVDLNRPLPPPPASATAESYEIPTLRRKQAPESPDRANAKHSHSRSFSHPFPSLFGSKKSDKKQKAAELDGAEEDGADYRNGDGFSRSLGPEHSQKGDRQPVTGKCMTCDSTVRWPQGLKVFRCTTCLTINDLEAVGGEKRGESTATLAGPSPQRKTVPLSLDRTKALLDRCVMDYLDHRLGRSEEHGRYRPVEARPQTPVEDTSFLLDGSSPEGTIDGQVQDEQDSSPPPSPRPRMKERSPSEPALSRGQAIPAARPGTSHFVRGASEDPFSTSAPNHRRPQDGRSRELADNGPVYHNRPVAVNDVFRVCESYLAGCFVGCATLNNSFLTPQAPQESKARSNSGSQLKKHHQSEPVPPPANDGDVFLSELDAKTLLLGDFVENGSWWLGAPNGRERSAGKESSNQRERSPDKWRGTASSRNPRVNWVELAEFYRSILYAGEHWEQKWHEMKAKSSDPREQQLWQTIPLESLRLDIMESRIHLHRTLLKVTENLLKRPRQPLKHAEDCRFLLLLLANPLLTPGMEPGKTPLPVRSHPPPHHPHPPATSGRHTEDKNRGPLARRVPSGGRRPGSLGHHSGILKRVLGLLANLSNEIHPCLVSWFSRYSDAQFQRTVEMVGGFVSYRLSRQEKRPVKEMIDPTNGLIPSFSDARSHHASRLHAAIDGRSSSNSATPREGKPKLPNYAEDWQVRVAARVMALLFQANIGHIAKRQHAPASQENRYQNPGLNAKYHAYSHGQIIPISCFYNTMLDYADLVGDFETWETTKSKFTFCQYPFFLSIYAKIHILEHDARRQMETKAREAFFDSILSRKAVSQFLVFRVRRDCLVEDSLRNVSEVVGSGGTDIKKGLRIDFVGEEGIDAGGLRKEWFLLLVREIFDPHHGLFVYDDDSQYCYFNPFCFESSEQFFLVGVLLGLAIYNSTILDIAFPPFVFRKMLASAPFTGDKLTSTPKVGSGYTLEDLAEFRPSLARGFRQLLNYDGDVQETFCRDFVAEMDRYGEVITVPLCPGGEKRAVTNSNRREFVDLYVHYLLDTAVVRQYEPFKRGFFSVCGGNALSLFRPAEIELLVRGSDEPLDIASLQAVATYEGWPKNEGPPEQQAQVVWFWEFFARVSPVDQRKILVFITGSDRIPAMGATNLAIRIQLLRSSEESDGLGRPLPNKDAERYPIARTCFNTLSLYRYPTREKLEQKLWGAVVGSEGFGLK